MKQPDPEISVSPVAAPLGAIIECGDLRKMTAERFKAVRKAWLDNLVIVFRGQTLDDGELLNVCRLFGKLGAAPSAAKMAAGQKGRDPRYPEINVISNVIEDGVPIGSFGYGEAAWHTDMAYEEIPHDGTMLYALEVPPTGGDTWFANMYLTCDTMPAKLLDRLKGLKIKHDLTYKPDGLPRKGYELVSDVRKMPGTPHPIIRTHPETGHNAIYIGQRRNAYILGLSVEESEALLDEIWAHAAQEQFTWHHHWKVGDLVVWDNRCTMHRRDPFDNQHRRVMHQGRVTGTKPYESVGAGKPHPRGSMRFPETRAA
jgi:taurine dioxygenase